MESSLDKNEENPNSISINNSNINGATFNQQEIKLEFSSPQKMLFNVDEIIEKCKEKNGIELLNYMCNIMHEKKRNILEALYKELGKEYLIIMLEKTLDIQNNGGLTKGRSIYPKKDKDKKSNENKPVTNSNIGERKSSGGIFFTLIKKDPQAKGIFMKAEKLDWKESRKRKKVYKLMDKLNI